MTAGDVMTADPETVTPEATVSDAWELMRERGVRHVPVVKDGALVGMLSDRDLIRFDLGRLGAMEGAGGLRGQLGTPVVQVMSTDVIAVEPDGYFYGRVTMNDVPRIVEALSDLWGGNVISRGGRVAAFLDPAVAFSQGFGMNNAGTIVGMRNNLAFAAVAQ